MGAGNGAPTPPRRMEVSINPTTLRISATHEDQFWACPASLQAANNVDSLNFCKRLYSNVVALLPLGLWSFAEASNNAPQRVALNCLLLSLLHKILERFFPSVYRSVRGILVLHFRLFTLLSTVAIALHSPRHPAFQYLSLHPFATVRASPAAAPPASLATTLQALALASAALPACAHALPATLPFRFELPIQLAYLLLLAAFFAVPATALLSLPAFHPATARLYVLLATGPRALLGLPHTPAATPSPSSCAWALVLTTQLFLGFALPVYITYTRELHRKTAFIRHLLPQPPPAAGPSNAHQPPSNPPQPHPANRDAPPRPFAQALGAIWAILQNMLAVLLLALLSWHLARLASPTVLTLLWRLPDKVHRGLRPWLAAFRCELGLAGCTAA